jgi:peptidoglycan/xylan/chitin deacetylase (PgdA/CDA1 family)
VLLTFDDGLRNNAEVATPIVRKHGVPAIYFFSSRHATPGKYLWFVYLSNLERQFKGAGFVFRERFMDMFPGRREATMSELTEALLRLRPTRARCIGPSKKSYLPWKAF